VDSTNCGATATARQTANKASASTTVTYGGMTIDNPNNWVIGFMGDTTSGQTCAPGTLPSVSATGEVRAVDSNAIVSSFSSATCSVTSSVWESVTMELAGPNPIASGSAPALKRSWGFSGMSSNAANCGTGSQICTGDDFIIYTETTGPRVTTANDYFVLALKNPIANTATISDDKSDSWSTALTCSDTNSKYSLFSASASANVNQIKIHFGAQLSDIQFALFLFYNVATSSPIDGSGICTTGITPTNNIAPNINSGSFTPGTSGDLILNQIFDNNHPLGVSNVFTDTVYGSGFTGLYGEVIEFGAAAQFQIQNSAAAINPGMTVVQTTHDTFVSMSIAIKPGPGGSAPTPGISIIRSQTAYITGGTCGTPPCNFAIPFSTPPGDLVVVGNEAGTAGASLTAVADSQSNVYTAVPCNAACVSGVPQHPQIYTAANAIPNNSNHVTVTIGTNTGNDLIILYDLAGAATSALDTGSKAANASTLTAPSSGATWNIATQGSAGQSFSDQASIQPSIPGDFIIDMAQVGNGPAGGCTGVAGTSNATYDYNTATWGPTGSGDNNGLSNGDASCHFYDSTTAVVNFGYTMVNSVISSIQDFAVAFQAPQPAGIGGKAGLGGNAGVAFLKPDDKINADEKVTVQ
jgi:hypothetical protein